MIRRGLGLVATGRRPIYSGTQYESFFDLSKIQGKDPILLTDGDNYDTLEKIDEIARRHAHQVKAIAAKLKASSVENSLRNLWNFLYHHVQYKQDIPSREQLRTPLRTWKDRASGVDCDCYSIFIKAVLINWGYSNASRMAAYSGDFQHVYIVVPMDGKKESLERRNKYYVVDPVVDRFDHEVPFTKKYDRFMKLGMSGLNGFQLGSSSPSCEGATKSSSGTGSALPRHYRLVSVLEQDGMVITEKFLRENGIPYEGTAISDGTLRLKVVTPLGTEELLPPVIGPEEAQIFLDKMNTVPTPLQGLGAAKKGNNTLMIIGVALTAAAVLAAMLSGDDNKEKSSTLNGPSQETPAVREKKVLKTVRI